MKLARFRNNLAKFLAAEGRYVEAEGELRQALDLVPDSESTPGSRWQRARAAHNLGTLLVQPAHGATGPDRKALVAQGFRSIRTAKDLLERLGKNSRRCRSIEKSWPLSPRTWGKWSKASIRRPRRWTTCDGPRPFPIGSSSRARPSRNTTCNRRESASSWPRSSLRRTRRCRSRARKSVEQLASLQPLYPEMPNYLGAALGRAYLGLSQVLLQRGQRGAAREAAERAVVYHQAAWRSNPGSPRFRSDLWDDHRLMAFIRLEVGDIAGAAKDAEELPRLQPDTGKSYIQAAWLLIKCAGASGDRRVHFYDCAMNVLARGVDRQVLDRHWLHHSALNPLRDREDFRRLQRPPTSAAAG